MSELLRFERRKLFRRSSFYICGGIGVVMIILSAILLGATSVIIETMTENQVDIGPVTSAVDFARDGLSNSSFTILVAIVISMFFCDDYKNLTIRNILAKGYSRTEIYVSKVLTVFFIGTIYYVVYFAVSFLTGLIMGGIGTVDSVGLYVCSILGQYIIAMGYVSLYVLISSLLKKSGGAIAISIVTPMVVPSLVNLINLIPDLPFNASNLLLNTHLQEMIAQDVSSTHCMWAIVTGLIYIVLSLVLGLVVIRKNEV